MQVNVDAGALRAALSMAIAKSGSLEILAHVLIAAHEEGGVSITSTDFAMEVESKIPAEVVEPGMRTAPAAQLKGVLTGIIGSVQLWSDDSKKTELRADKKRFDLPGFDSSAFPGGIEMEGPTRLEGIDREAFSSAIMRSMYAAARGQGRAYLEGVHIDGERVIAADSRRMAVVPLGVSVECRPFTIPIGSAAAIGKAVLNEGAEVFVSRASVEVRSPSSRIRSALIETPFPDWRMALRGAEGPSATLTSRTLTSALSRAAACVARRSNELKTQPILIDQVSGGLRITESSGAFEELVEAEVEAGWGSVCLNLPYLADVAASLGELVVWSNGGQLAMQAFSPSADSEEIHIVGPIKV